LNNWADGQLLISAQADLLSMNRRRLYYQPLPLSPEELWIKRRIDELYTACPFYGSRKITVELNKERLINRKAVQRHMREMGLSAICPGPNLSKRHADHAVFPYLLEFCDQLTVQLRMAIIQFNIHRHHIFFSALTKRTHLVPAASRPALSVGQVVTAMSHAFGRLHSGGPRSFVLPERTQTPPFGGPRLAKTSVSYELGAVIERSLFVFWCLLKSVPPDRKTQVISSLTMSDS